MATTPRILVVGGTGKVGSRLVRYLLPNSHIVRIASRKPLPNGNEADIEYRYFQWADETTYQPLLAGVERLFLVAPIGVADPSAQMLTFLDQALQAGVQRVVLLGSSLIVPGTPGLGMVHQAIQERIPEWAVLRPSWFMQNFVEDHYHAASIKQEGVIVTAAGEGRIGFIDAEDIAAVGARALMDERPHNTEHLLTGPQTLSYTNAATILSEAFGRSIRAIIVSPEEMQARIVAYGIPASFAKLLAQAEYQLVRNGLEDRVTPTVEQITGHLPRSLADFAATYVKHNQPIHP
jgi:uncharacterized protein YbjT (DUF2867 family)